MNDIEWTLFFDLLASYKTIWNFLQPDSAKIQFACFQWNSDKDCFLLFELL